MKVVRGAFGSLGVFALAAFAACHLHASTWTVTFDPSNSVNAAGWDLSQATEQNKTSQSPAGRKLAPGKGASAFIESPVHSSRIRTVAVSFKCVNAKSGNAATVEVFGRPSENADYQSLFAETGIPGTPTNLCSTAYETPLDTFDCRQVKIVYTKDTSGLNGNLIISSVVFTDDADSDDVETSGDTETGDGESTDDESGGGEADKEVETDKSVVLRQEDSSFTFSVDALTEAKGKWDVAGSPFRFFLEGVEKTELSSRNATKQIQKGVYVCTNVFETNWAVLVPGAPDRVADICDAECRLTIRTAAFAVRRLEFSADFAQLYATNTQEKALSLQYRTIALDGSASDWTELGEYRSTYTMADVSPDLVGTRKPVTCADNVRIPRGATVEARVYCRKKNDSGREAPLGFRDFRVRVLGVGPPLVYVIR